MLFLFAVPPRTAFVHVHVINETYIGADVSATLALEKMNSASDGYLFMHCIDYNIVRIFSRCSKSSKSLRTAVAIVAMSFAELFMYYGLKRFVTLGKTERTRLRLLLHNSRGRRRRQRPSPKSQPATTTFQNAESELVSTRAAGQRQREPIAILAFCDVHATCM